MCLASEVPLKNPLACIHARVPLIPCNSSDVNPHVKEILSTLLKASHLCLTGFNIYLRGESLTHSTGQQMIEKST